MKTVPRLPPHPGRPPDPEDNLNLAGQEPPLFIIRRLFPRIADSIELLWGDRDLDGYLNKLIVADREDREGFPAPVLLALLRLHNQHARQFKFRTPEEEWAVEDRIDRVKTPRRNGK